MKNIFLTLLLFVVSVSFSQTKIDYNNFNNDLATKILAKKFIEFRDTITLFGSNLVFTDVNPEIIDNPDLMIPKWSDYLYNNTSNPNCSTIIKEGHSARHVDVSKWFYSEDTKWEISQIKFKGSKIPKSSWSPLNSSMIYRENACSLMDKLQTYEDLATYIIMLWENSKEHRRAQRGYTYSTFSYKKYNEKIYGIFSCKVMYDKNTEVTKAVLNLVN
jgi:hypothetical protein